MVPCVRTMVISCRPRLSPSTAIGLRKYRIPSDLRSQAEYRLVSTTVGDHVGILGAVVFFFFSPPRGFFSFLPEDSFVSYQALRR